MERKEPLYERGDGFWLCYAVSSVITLILFLFCLWWIITGLQNAGKDTLRQHAETLTQALIQKIEDTRYDNVLKIDQLTDYAQSFQNRTLQRPLKSAAQRNSLVDILERGITARASHCPEPLQHDMILALLQILHAVADATWEDCQVANVFTALEHCEKDPRVTDLVLSYLSMFIGSTCEDDLFNRMIEFQDKMEDLEWSSLIVRFWVDRINNNKLCQIATPILEKSGQWTAPVKENMCFVLQKVPCDDFESLCGEEEL